jgi:hypothetical protein
LVCFHCWVGAFLARLIVNLIFFELAWFFQVVLFFFCPFFEIKKFIE